ncbi:hypothetical protein [Paenibacillus medicaginis]|uniref:Uncharacterized protein n=1 Tax=Paenibacillus medicaginis TaxID=1470560 RepID=A0ABV5C7N5_9BACL
MDELKKMLEGFGARFDALDANFEQLNKRFDNLELLTKQNNEMATQLIGKVASVKSDIEDVLRFRT